MVGEGVGDSVSAEVFPVFNPSVPSADFDAHGGLLLQEFESLDRIAADLELTLFGMFGDNREIPDDFDGDLDELDDSLGEWEEWFSIDDGLRTIDGIIEAVNSDPDKAALFQEPHHIVSDLESLSRSLRLAKDHGAQFRLEAG
jgi:hypothetical protein